MIQDLLRDSPQSAIHADVAIVGAGAAGIVLAVELARRGREVLLLEGGGAEIEEASQDPYRSEVAGLPHRGIHAGRFRVQGGTTTMWGGQILELNDLDFEERPWVSGSGWPISKAELQDHYARALELEGVSGGIRNDEDVWKAVGEVTPKFDQIESYLSRWCPEPDFARLHRRSLSDDPHIQLWLHANVIELLMEDERATGVRCRTLAGTEATFRARQFVFAMGAIESSRFFLQPRRLGNIPWNQSGLLGCHFQDHIDSTAASVRPKMAGTFHRDFDTIFLHGRKYSPKLCLAANAQKELEVLNVGATMFSVDDGDQVLSGLKTSAKQILRGRFRELAGAQVLQMFRHSPLLARQAFRYAVQHRAFHPASSEIKLRVHCEQQPDSISSITLSDERDQLGLLRTRLRWCISPMELHSIRSFVEVIRRSLAGMAEIIPEEGLRAGEAQARALCQDSFHHSGGMRMAASPSCGVVDTDLKLNGTHNVFICSSATFPTSGFSNPTHTLLALAARLAAHIASES